MEREHRFRTEVYQKFVFAAGKQHQHWWNEPPEVRATVSEWSGRRLYETVAENRNTSRAVRYRYWSLFTYWITVLFYGSVSLWKYFFFWGGGRSLPFSFALAIGLDNILYYRASRDYTVLKTFSTLLAVISTNVNLFWYFLADNSSEIPAVRYIHSFNVTAKFYLLLDYCNLSFTSGLKPTCFITPTPRSFTSSQTAFMDYCLGRFFRFCFYFFLIFRFLDVR